MKIDHLDWLRVAKLAECSRDELLSDLAALARLVAAADRNGLIRWPNAHKVVVDVSILDRLYHVGLVHLACDPACCGTPRRREWYSVHRFSDLA